MPEHLHSKFKIQNSKLSSEGLPRFVTPLLAAEETTHYYWVMKENLLLYSHLDSSMAKQIEKTGLQPLWTSAEPVPGGRGTAGKTVVAGRTMFAKKESRGGLAGKILPDRYFFRSPFDAEWMIAARAADAGLSPRVVARSLVRHSILFEVFTLEEWIEGVVPLEEPVRNGTASREDFFTSGKTIALLHQEGIVHGDLNAGNILLNTKNEAFIVDFRHSDCFSDPPTPSVRRSNLRRLARSLTKIRALGAPAFKSPPLPLLAEGYAQGWGEREEWLDAWQGEAPAAYRFRRLLWRN